MTLFPKRANILPVRMSLMFSRAGILVTVGGGVVGVVVGVGIRGWRRHC
jgi:hypothetical protein